MSWPTADEKFPEPPTQPDGTREWSPLVKLAMRMGWASKSTPGMTLAWDNVMLPFEYVSAYKCKTSNKVFVFGVVRGIPMQFEDDAYLFPTDSLICRLKLLT